MAYTKIRCPHCTATNDAQHEWVNMELTCSSCGNKFIFGPHLIIPGQNMYPQQIQPAKTHSKKWFLPVMVGLIVCVLLGSAGFFFMLFQKQQHEAEAIIAAEKAKAEKAKQALEAVRIAEEKRKAEAEIARIAEEKRKAEEAARLEALRLAEEKRKAEEEIAARIAEEKRKAEEKRLAEEKSAREAAEKAAREKAEKAAEQYVATLTPDQENAVIRRFEKVIKTVYENGGTTFCYKRRTHELNYIHRQQFDTDLCIMFQRQQGKEPLILLCFRSFSCFANSIQIEFKSGVNVKLTFSHHSADVVQRKDYPEIFTLNNRNWDNNYHDWMNENVEHCKSYVVLSKQDYLRLFVNDTPDKIRMDVFKRYLRYRNGHRYYFRKYLGNVEFLFSDRQERALRTMALFHRRMKW